MYARGEEVASMVEEFAPPHMAFPGDPTGLQWGDLGQEVKRVLLALDFSTEVLEEAVSLGSEFVVVHHPYLFQPIQRLDFKAPREALLARAIKEEVALYAAHTNLDVAPNGVSQALGEVLGLQKMEILEATGGEEYLKLVVFAPEGYEETVREAISAAGAGWIGLYSHCTFQVSGMGTFLPRGGASPFIGNRGSLERIKEFRLETILPRKLEEKVLAALLEAHPYEEPSFDLSPLANRAETWGLGRIGWMEKKMPLKTLAHRCVEKLQPPYLKMVGEPEREVKRIAVLGGSGADRMDQAAHTGAEVFITGDIRYHEAQRAEELGLALLDPSHGATEKPVLPVLARHLREKMAQKGLETEVVVAGREANVWRLLKNKEG